MNTQKLLIILIVVLVVIFVAGIVLGVRDRGGPQKANLTELAPSSLQSYFSRPLDLRELTPNPSTPGCLQTATQVFVIPALQTCTFQIAGSRTPPRNTRKLGLHLQTPAAIVEVTLAQPHQKGAFTVTQTLPKDEPVDLSIFGADGATLTLVCTASVSECRVAIL